MSYKCRFHCLYVLYALLLVPPPCAPPLRRYEAPGWATPSRKPPPSAEDRG
jgi:hypothetical protein